MKNKSYRVVSLVAACFFIYLILSILSFNYDWKWEPFDKINLVAEVFHKGDKSDEGLQANGTSAPKNTSGDKASQDFDLYKKPNFITNFQKDENAPALAVLTEKLATLKQTGKGKVRIAFFGDSMIEGDLISQTFRKLLQQEFGGNGVGFLPMYSKVAGFRQTASVSGSGWQDISFKTKGATNMYISGHQFIGKGSGTYTDNTISEGVVVEKSILYGKADNAYLEINGQETALNGANWVNRKVVARDASNTLKVKSNTEKLPFYGVSFESENGVFVDNFSFRGITGVELAKIDVDFLKSVQASNAYDLIILQYGVNLLFRAKDTEYSHYEKIFTPVLQNMKTAFPDTDVLLIGAADRAFRYDGEFKTAIGLPNLIKLQAQMAFDNGLAFYNQFESMGGQNSIVEWATQKPALANKDYIHPNAKGAEVLAQKLFNALMNDYKKYQTSITSK